MRISYSSFLILAVALLVSSCELIGNIFGAGVYVGVFLSVLVLGLIIYLIVRATRNK